MTYSVKEAYFTLQGEGAQAGMAAVFCRFAGCNLWTGLERDRSTAICQFCDTDFIGTNGENGGKFETADLLADHVKSLWTGRADNQLVVFTGGEPLLQLDTPLIDALHRRGFRIAVESNGTIEPPNGIDWLCISPKAGSDWIVRHGDELKLVYPQEGLLPDELGPTNFKNYFLQPMDDPLGDKTLWASRSSQTVAYVKANPKWRLSVQSHKYLDIP